MADVRTLRAVQPPTAQAEIREQVVALLERTLAEAKAGEIDEVFMIIRHPGSDEWSDRATPTMGFTSWIGKLEIVKQTWIANFNERHAHG